MPASPFRHAAAAFALLALAATAPARADTELAKPEPTPDNPRRVMLQLTSGDEKDINGVLYNAVNIQDFYGQDNVEVAIIAFGAGMAAFYKDSSPVKDRISSLLKYDVQFIGCGNTMKTQNRGKDDLLPGIEIATAGIAEIMERQLKGWIYVKP